MSKIKSLFFISTVILIFATAITPVFAHSGRTDANGGHYDTATGEYHYHHGHPAHQHTNGKCPYDYDDKTNSISSLSLNTSSSNNSEDKPGFAAFLGSAIIFALIAGAIYMFGFFANDKYDDSAKKTIKIIIIVIWAIVSIVFGMNVCF